MISPSHDDTVDLAEVGRSLRARWPWLAGGLAAGLVVAVAASLLIPQRYDGAAKILIRGADSRSPMLAGLQGMLGGFLPGGGGSAVETELEILTSRSLAEEVVDSLDLRVAVAEPEGVTAAELFADVRIDAELPLARPAVLRFERTGDAYRVSSPGGEVSARPGVPLQTPVGTFVLRPGELPDAFSVTVVDMRDAVGALHRRLRVEESGAEVVRIEYRSPDPRLAAEVPNVLVSRYLARRSGVDRGVNRSRYEFLVVHADSLGRELAAAEEALRIAQERSGVFDPEMYGQSEYERALRLRGERETLDVEIRALTAILGPRGGASLSARELAAYPTFLRNGAINDLLGRILQLQTERGTLLERRTPADPEVQVLAANVENLEAQLVGLSRSYLSGLQQQQAEVARELQGYESTLTRLPAQAQESYRLQREVKRLGETLLALEGQLVQTRLAAMGEGGDVRVIDRAEVPLRPTFPSPPLFLALGIVGGVLAGAAGALVRGLTDRRIHSVRDAERASGLPALEFDPEGVLLLARAEEMRCVLVVPVDGASRSLPVAEKIVATLAASHGPEAVLADLTSIPRRAAGAVLPPVRANGGEPEVQPLVEAGHQGYALARFGGDDVGALRAHVGELELRFPAVVAALPPLGAAAGTLLLSSSRTVVLVACRGRTTADQLRETAAALERVGVPVAGVVLQRPGRDAGRQRN